MGVNVGCEVGKRVGCDVGIRVGGSVGCAVGFNVGAAVVGTIIAWDVPTRVGARMDNRLLYVILPRPVTGSQPVVA